MDRKGQKNILPLQPNDIFLSDPPTPSDLKGRYPLRPQTSIDGLRVHSKLSCQLIDREVILHLLSLPVFVLLPRMPLNGLAPLHPTKTLHLNFNPLLCLSLIVFYRVYLHPPPPPPHGRRLQAFKKILTIPISPALGE